MDVGRALGILLKCRCDLSSLGQGLGLCTFHKLQVMVMLLVQVHTFSSKELDQWFSMGDDFAPHPGDIWQWPETFLGCHDEEGEDATGNYWVEARNASQYSIMHRTAPTTKNHPVQNVSSVAVEELWS